MTELQRRLQAVRQSWRQTQALAGLLMLAADAVVVILALVAVDAIYNLSGSMRGGLLLAGLGVLAAAAVLVLVRPLRRHPSDEEVALSVEHRFPELQGTLITAVEYELKPRGDQLQAELVDALMVDCLQRAARIDLAGAIDHRRLMRRGLAAGILLAFFLGGVAQSGNFKREIVRVLAPWANRPENEQVATTDEEAELRRLQQLAASPARPDLKIDVTPGNTEVLRGGRIPVQVTVSEAVSGVSLMYKDSQNNWRPKSMMPDPSVPNQFQASLTDITESMEYKAVAPGKESAVFKISVFDPAEVRGLKVTLTYPAYTEQPPKVIEGMDASFEAVEDTVAKITVISTSEMQTGRIKLFKAKEKDYPKMLANGKEISGEVTVKDTDTFAIEATDTHGNALKLPGVFTMKAFKDQAPKLEVLYPMMDTMCHPMEEVGFGCKVSDDVGIKEVRVVYFYNMLDKQSLVLSGKNKAGVPTQGEMLADFVMPLEEQPLVQPYDMILYYFEVEDTHKQTIASDIYKTTVRPWEAWAVYGGPGHMGATHGYAGAELINIVAATWALGAERDAAVKAGLFQGKETAFKKQCETIAEKMMRQQKPPQ